MNPMVESAVIAAVATLVGVGGTVVVSVVGSRNSRLTNERTLEAGRESELADRYSRAIEQLGAQVVDVRTGGIYALEGIALDSSRNHPTVMEVLTAFIREHSRWASLSDPNGQGQTTRPDLQAAVTVVARRNVEHDIRVMDLNSADLTYARLAGARLARADLTRADLTSADLTIADLTCADLTFARLTAADLAGARWPEGVPVPDGWMADGDSGRLQRAGQLSEVMDHYP